MQINKNYNKNIIVTNTGKKYEKPSTAQNVAGILTANIASGLVVKAMTTLPGKNFAKETTSVTPQDKEFFASIADTVFEKSKLSSKGIKLIDAIEENRNEINEIWKKVFKIDTTKLPQFKQILNSIFNGHNAVFNKHTKTIIINKEKLSVALAHEIGHALNATGKGLGRMLSRTRDIGAAISLVTLSTALLKRKKVEGEEPKGLFDTTTTFVKNHCGKITALCMLPTVAEEALATKKGEAIIKNLNIPDLCLNKLKKLNRAGLLTHVVASIAMILSVVTASKIKDIMTIPKEITE